MKGIAWTPKTCERDKTLRLGNDATNKCTTATWIPENFAGRPSHLHVSVLPGNTALFFPKSPMDHFGLVIDFGRKRWR